MGIVRTFDIDRPFVARQAFEFSGRVYAPGDLFPWREVGTERDVRTLWRAMLVANGEPVAVPAPPAPPKAPAPDPKPGKRPRAGA